jgi:hypothetical protein
MAEGKIEESIACLVSSQSSQSSHDDHARTLEHIFFMRGFFEFACQILAGEVEILV